MLSGTLQLEVACTHLVVHAGGSGHLHVVECRCTQIPPESGSLQAAATLRVRGGLQGSLFRPGLGLIWMAFVFDPDAQHLYVLVSRIPRQEARVEEGDMRAPGGRRLAGGRAVLGALLLVLMEAAGGRRAAFLVSRRDPEAVLGAMVLPTRGSRACSACHSIQSSLSGESCRIHYAKRLWLLADL